MKSGTTNSRTYKDQVKTDVQNTLGNKLAKKQHDDSNVVTTLLSEIIEYLYNIAINS